MTDRDLLLEFVGHLSNEDLDILKGCRRHMEPISYACKELIDAFLASRSPSQPLSPSVETAGKREGAPFVKVTEIDGEMSYEYIHNADWSEMVHYGDLLPDEATGPGHFRVVAEFTPEKK